MSTFTVTTRMTHRYLMNKTKDELCSLIGMIFDGEEARLGYTVKLVEEAEKIVSTLKAGQTVQFSQCYPLDEAIENVRLVNELGENQYAEHHDQIL